ncbi:MAG: DUF3592 domain-containing protein [Anaerolineaceae bacterium]
MDQFPLGFGLLCGGFFFLLTLAVGVGLLVYSANSKKKAGASQSWPGVPGTITVSDVRQSSSTDDDGHVTFSYYPRVEYTYEVAGQSFTSKQVAFGGVRGYGNPEKARQDLAKYPAGAAVTVFYNPEKPGEAVLERAAGSGAKTAKTMGIIVLVMSFCIACPLLIGVIRNFFQG